MWGVCIVMQAIVRVLACCALDWWETATNYLVAECMMLHISRRSISLPTAEPAPARAQDKARAAAPSGIGIGSLRVGGFIVEYSCLNGI